MSGSGIYNAEKTKARRQPWEKRETTCQVGLLGGRHLPRPTSTYTAATATREAKIKPIVSGMAGAIELSHLFMQANAELVDTLVKALQGMGHAPPPFVSESPGDPTIDAWLPDFDVFVRQCGVPEGERVVVLIDYIGGCAEEEVLCHPHEVRWDFGGPDVSAAASVWPVRDIDVAAS